MNQSELNISHYVEKHDITKVAELLSADPSRVNELFVDEGTPMHIAVLAANKEMVELLLYHRPDLNAQDSMGDTPLHVAARLGLRAIAETLVRGGAGVSVRNRSGMTPVDVADSVAYDDTKAVAQYLRSLR